MELIRDLNHDVRFALRRDEQCLEPREEAASHRPGGLGWAHRHSQRAVTPFGGVDAVLAYLRKIGMVRKVPAHMPVLWRSPHQTDPTATFTSFLISMLLGVKRSALAHWLRGDRVLHAWWGLNRFPPQDTIRNLFRQSPIGNLERWRRAWMRRRTWRMPKSLPHATAGG